MIRKLLNSLLIPVIIFITYYSRLCPTYYFWDSAELTAAVVSNGVPHPPGFPGYLIIAKIWTWLMPIEPAFSLNVLSLFFGAVGLFILICVVDLFSQKVKYTDKDPDILLFVVIIFSLFSILSRASLFSFSIQMLRAEVYTLNFACFAAIMFLMFYYEKSKSKIILYLLAGMIGFGLTLHNLTIALTIPGVLFYLWFEVKIGWRKLIKLGVIAFLTLIPFYYYIAYLAQSNPYLNWGDPSNITNFLNYFFVKEFSVSSSSISFSHIIDNLVFALQLISKQIGIVGLFVAFIGVFMLIRRNMNLGISLLLIFILNIFSIIFMEDYFYNNYDIHGYLMIAIGLTLVFLYYPLFELWTFVYYKSKTFREEYSQRNAYFAFTFALFLILSPRMFTGEIEFADLGHVDGARDISQQYYDKNSDDCVIITSYYSTYFALMAEKSVSQNWSSRDVLNIYNWDHQWGREQAARNLNIDIETDTDRMTFYRNLINSISDRDIYIEYDDSSKPIANYLIPDGIAYRFSLTDSLTVNSYKCGYDASELFKSLRYPYEYETIELETARYWMYWFDNRAKFYEYRGYPDVSDMYRGYIDSLAALIPSN